MKKNLVILLMIMNVGLLFAADPVVENVRLEQRSDGSLKADIYYDVTDADGDTLPITLQASDDDGATWQLPVSHVSGDIGDSVLTGTGKHIVWDFLADNPGISGDGFRIRVTASDYNGPEMVFVKGGTFDMGSTNGENDEKPVHTVTLDDFYIDKYEVTNSDYADFLNSALSDGLIIIDNTRVKKDTLTLFNLGAEDCQIAFLNGQFVVDDAKENNPVIHVTWNGAKAYAEYFGKRLPTEAEWEYAARGGSESQGYTYSGGNEMDVVGWFAQNSDNSSQPVGQKQANELGIYDMSGNVWEWCADRYDRDYYSTGPGDNPYGPSDVNKTGRILRGGAWDEAMSKARPANRNRDKAWLGYSNRGFRCAKGDTNFIKLDVIRVTPQDVTIKNNESLQVTCTAQYSDGSTVNVSKYASWNIIYGNSGIIDTDGLFTADSLATGSVKIKVLFDGLTAETTITVDSKYETGTMTDIDGNVYKTVKIGDQWWIAENLKVTHYRNGDPIPNLIDNTEWAETMSGAYCYYNNDISNAEDYGALYNWFVLSDSRNIAPEGWHIPTDKEWKKLELFLGISKSEVDDWGSRGNYEGGKLKETGSAYWNSYNTGATNESGFSARPGGCRIDLAGDFKDMGKFALYWSATETSDYYAWSRRLSYNNAEVYRNYFNKRRGFSIRLVRGEETPSELESINITQPYSIVYNGETLQLNCTTNFTDGSSVDISNETTWSITSGSAGTIDNNGLFTSSNSKTGVVTITASYKNQTAETIISVQNNSLETGTMTDNDGNVYRTVKIGNQWWMAENLRVTHYRNGDLIPNATDAAEWDVLSGAFCYYDNDKKNAAIYGALYNWYAVDDERNIAPEGWHVPSDEEWKEMEMFLGMSMSDVEIDDSQYRGTDEGGKLKEMGTVESRNGLWQKPNTGATNESGFSARPGGHRYPNTGIDFSYLGSYAAFWTATQSGYSTAKMRYLTYNSDMITRYGLYLKHGRSIRLVKDRAE